MTDYRLISSPAHAGEPARIDLDKAPEYRAYMAHEEEILFLCRPSDIPDHARYLRSNGDHVAFGPSYDTLLSQQHRSQGKLV
jgi:hypothetical protein